MARLSGRPHTDGLADAREGARFFYHQTAPILSPRAFRAPLSARLETFGLPKVEAQNFHSPMETSLRR